MDIFSKSIDGYIEHKKKLYEANSELLIDDNHFRELYSSQVNRIVCIVCEMPSQQASIRLTVRGISYWSCTNCDHLNGDFLETDEFCTSLYSSSISNDYGSAYFAESLESYNRRKDDIYLPKAKFLSNTMRKVSLDFDSSIVDYGCGSGYFVAAMRDLGFTSIQGLDVSESQIRHGNALIEGGTALHQVHSDDYLNQIKSFSPKVVSLLGVLEHLQRPTQRLKEISSIESVEYILISVPTFSMSIFLESVFPNVYPRQTSAGHTHLFSVNSLNHCTREATLTTIDSWWFGTDILDLVRSVSVELEIEARDQWLLKMLPLVDGLQAVLDQNKWCSEVHQVLQVNR
jgi:hypothetical protein